MDVSPRTENITFEKWAFHFAAPITNSNIAADWWSTSDFTKRVDSWTVTERNWCQIRKNNDTTLNLHTQHSWISLPYLQKPKQILYNKKGNKVFFLRGMNYILTGPIIVACQWNTESQKDRTIRDFSELSHNQKKVSSDKALWGAYSHLQQAQRSSGLAGLAAGHSAPIRNTQIFERHPHEKKHGSAAPLQTWESK